MSTEKAVQHHDTYPSNVTLINEGTSCNSGVIVTEKCYDCDWTGQHETMEHIGAVTESFVITDIEGCCGGRYNIKICACGEDKFLERHVSCDLTGNMESKTGEDGLTHLVTTYTCSKCDVWYTEDQYTEPGENGIGTQHNVYTFYDGEAKLNEMSTEKAVSEL